MKHKFLKHTGDIKFQSYGKSLEEAFSNSARALKETIAGKIKIKGKIKKKIKIKGRDIESLLYRFLEEFLILLDADDFLLNKIISLKINKSKFILNCEVIGDKASDYHFSNDVKAVTYNQMFVKKEKDKWVCQVVLDV